MTESNAAKEGPLSPLLLIDDDISLATLLAEYCAEAGFSITTALSGEEGLGLAQCQAYELIVLDVMLPDTDGFEVLRQLGMSVDTPVLMLTTRGAAVDRIRGLDGGADDYLAKPFQPEELVARIKSILRRTGRKKTKSLHVAADLVVDERRHLVSLDGTDPALTGAEFHLLSLLLSNIGEAMSREVLIPKILGREPHTFDRAIDNLVNNLRKKLGPHPDGSDRIKSVRNIGYCYVLPNVSEFNA